MSDFYRGKLVTVTGSTGLNGSYIVKALVEAGARVRAISHIRPPNEFTKLASEVVIADLADVCQIAEAVRGAEIVMRAAGITGRAHLAPCTALSVSAPIPAWMTIVFGWSISVGTWLGFAVVLQHFQHLY